MSENAYRTIKYLSISLIIVMCIILLFQSVVIVNQKKISNDINSQLSGINNQYEKAQTYQEQLSKNKETLKDKHLREDLDLIKINETYIQY